MKKLMTPRSTEHRPPWSRQIISPTLPTVKMLSLGGERLPPFPPPPLLPAPRSGMLPLVWWVFVAHFLVLEYPDHHQNLIISSSSLHYPRPLHKILFKSVHNFLSNFVHRQTDKQTDKPTLPKT